MAQWINLPHNNSFINRTQLPLLCEKSGAILLVLVDLTAGRLAVQQAVQQAVRQNTDRFEIFLNSLRIASVGFSWRLTYNIYTRVYIRICNIFTPQIKGCSCAI